MENLVKAKNPFGKIAFSLAWVYAVVQICADFRRIFWAEIIIKNIVVFIIPALLLTLFVLIKKKWLFYVFNVASIGSYIWLIAEICDTFYYYKSGPATSTVDKVMSVFEIIGLIGFVGLNIILAVCLSRQKIEKPVSILVYVIGAISFIFVSLDIAQYVISSLDCGFDFGTSLIVVGYFANMLSFIFMLIYFAGGTEGLLIINNQGYIEHNFAEDLYVKAPVQAPMYNQYAQQPRPVQPQYAQQPMQQPQYNQPVQNNLNVEQELEKYKNMLDKGLIDQEDYDKKKAELLK